jgi:hypothetical protein
LATRHRQGVTINEHEAAKRRTAAALDRLNQAIQGEATLVAEVAAAKIRADKRGRETAERLLQNARKRSLKHRDALKAARKTEKEAKKRA